MTTASHDRDDDGNRRLLHELKEFLADHDTQLLDRFTRRIRDQLNRMEHIMTEVNADQAKLDTDITAIGTAVATIVAELKAQAAAGVPLDFTAADALVASTGAEAAADAPPAA